MTERKQARLARALAVPSRAEILRRLREAGQPLGVDELASAMRLHINTVRQHLDLLCDVDLVERGAETPTRPGRPRVRYRIRPKQADPATGYRMLANALAEQVAVGTDHPARAAAEAGRRWALGGAPAAGEQGPYRGDEAVDAVVDLLDRLGFEPRTEPLGDRIYLHACPFSELARRNPTVICGVHLGLLRGAFERLAAPVTVSQLDSFVLNDLCVAHLRYDGAGTDGRTSADRTPQPQEPT